MPNIGGNKLKNFDFELYKSSYVAIIDRECFFKVPISLHIKPSVYVIEKSSYFHCVVTSYWVDFGIKGREVSIGGMGQGLERPNSENLNLTYDSLPKSLPNELPKWHEKLDPTVALINSFVLSEDSQEVRNLFY